MNFLEFEKPIAELIDQLEKTREISIKNNVDLSAATKELEEKITEKRKEIYDSLTPWKRCSCPGIPTGPMPSTISMP